MIKGSSLSPLINAAIDAGLESSYVPADETIAIDFSSPEDLYRKKEAYTKLSKEAILLLQLIYHMPTEMLEACTNTPKQLRKSRFVEYIRSHFNWKPRDIEKHLRGLRGLI
jgi:hypothetical protein